MEDLKKENELLRKRVAELEKQLYAKAPTAFTPQQKADPFEKVDKLTNQEIYRFGRQLLTIYNYNNGPCFRCLHPIPPPAAAVGKCVDNGVVGVVPGVIGILQALEAIKVAIGSTGKAEHNVAMSNPMFRTMRLRQKKKDCAICGESPTITELIDYVQFCQGEANDDVVSEHLLKREEHGQLTIYNYNNGPCFRCLHPIPPPAAAVGKCVDNGVVGVVPGVIGILQALEAIKVAIGSTGKAERNVAMNNPMFRTMRLRQKKKDCAICGENPTITELIDYVEFCQGEANDDVVSEHLLKREERIDVDVRPCLLGCVH
ncbi:hypothetical protein RMCBS344292_12709 [Rhizopus microsporus]|nr:hypothetical protein RMCBS344292_12709 [Rhizopus microsporus]